MAETANIWQTLRSVTISPQLAGYDSPGLLENAIGYFAPRCPDMLPVGIGTPPHGAAFERSAAADH